MASLKIPAVLMRGGTSKGLFFKKKDLQTFSSALQNKIFQYSLGSPDPFCNQIDGVGGATSSSSKIAIISKSKKKDIDIEYCFGAVSIEKSLVDFSGSCGNLAAAAGLFAIQQKLIKKEILQNSDEISVRIWQQNLGQKIRVKVKLEHGQAIEEGEFSMDGVRGTGNEIQVFFEKPGFGKQSMVFPSGKIIDLIDFRGKTIEATLVNVGNPTVFVHAQDLVILSEESYRFLENSFFLPSLIHININQIKQYLSLKNFLFLNQNLTGEENHISDVQVLKDLELVRCQAAIKMGLGSDVEEISKNRPATPKICFINSPKDYFTSNGLLINSNQFDILARILSMEKLHHAFTGTGAIALSVACAIEGTVPNKFLKQNIQQEKLKITRIGHRAGLMSIFSEVELKNSHWTVDSVGFSRTARRLMEGHVFLPKFIQK